MADLSQTAANVQPGANAVLEPITFGGTVTAGMPLYKDTSDNKWKPADADAEASSMARCIAMCGGADGQRGIGQFAGDFNPGATVAVGETYVVSTTAGGIAPEADLLSGDFNTVIGVGISTSQIRLGFVRSGVAHA